METRKLLEELENAVLNASDVPFTNKKMVDKDDVSRIILLLLIKQLMNLEPVLLLMLPMY